MMYFIYRSSHWYSVPCGDDPIGPELVTFLRVFSMDEGMTTTTNYCRELKWCVVGTKKIPLKMGCVTNVVYNTRSIKRV